MKLNQSNSDLRICVDSIAQGQISGRVYGQRLEHPLVFADIGDMLLQIDDILNAQDYPRAFQRKRSFGVEQKSTAPLPIELEGVYMSKETVETSYGKIATYNVNITTRQNTSWQGIIDWLDDSPIITFRSALEFIHIINEAIKK
ncbi:MAG: hypothetical protein FWG61_08355 [Firmicutes bacterium]|nr:hypothetical protein [Bacillota bacterium]